MRNIQSLNAHFMVIGVLNINFRLHGISSLKAKRKISNCLKQKLKNKFNMAVAEVGSEDSLEHLELGLITLANEKIRVEEVLGKSLAMIEAISTEDIMDVKTDIFRV
jgi:uncharacterized protein